MGRIDIAGRARPGHPRAQPTEGTPLHPDLVIFDCDGVLVDSERLSCATLADVLTAAGAPTTPDECARDFTGGTVALIRDVTERRTGRPLPGSFEETYARALFERFRRDLRAFDGVTELLDGLDAAGVGYCVASNGTRRRMEASLGATGLLPRFEGRLFSGPEVTRPKPAPDLFLHAAATLGATPASCLVVEDTPTGIAAARAAGMTVWAPATTFDRQRLATADAVFPAMASLGAALLADLGRGATERRYAPSGTDVRPADRSSAQ